MKVSEGLEAAAYSFESVVDTYPAELQPGIRQAIVELREMADLSKLLGQ